MGTRGGRRASLRDRVPSLEAANGSKASWGRKRPFRVNRGRALTSDHDDLNPFAAPASQLGIDADSPGQAGGLAFAIFLLVYFVLSFFFIAVCWGVLWSLWMSWFMGWDLLTVLLFRGLPGGVFLGGFVSLFITGYMGLFMRRRRISIPFGDRAEFVDRFDREIKRRRFRSRLNSRETLVYVPKALIRTSFFDVFVKVGEGEAIVTGPSAVISYLSRRLRQSA